MFGREMAMNQTCYALANTSKTPFALYCLLRREINGLVQAAHGSVFDTITTATFELSRVVLVDRRALAGFENVVSPPFHRVLTGIEEYRTLAALRDTLLPKLFSGQIRVEDTDRLLERIL